MIESAYLKHFIKTNNKHLRCRQMLWVWAQHEPVWSLFMSERSDADESLLTPESDAGGEINLQLLERNINKTLRCSLKWQSEQEN